MANRLIKEFTYLIPGQMSESPGMGRLLLERHPEALQLLKVTEGVWGLDLERIVASGTEEEIHRDGVSQPLITWYAYALYQALAARGFEARAVTGYSVGAFPGLAIAGALPFEQAQRILKANYDLVLPSGHRGAMLAVGGLPLAKGRRLLRGREGLAVGVVNSDISWTLTGTPEGIAAAERDLEGRAFQMYRLPVDWAIHSPLLDFVTEAILKNQGLWRGVKKPALPFFSPFTGRTVRTPAAARAILAGIISRCMRWDRLADAAVGTGLPLVEASESRFLQKLFKFHPARPKAMPGIRLLD
jgi:myxalamid-type polyketide synthase MxaE and MxaD